MSEYAGLDADGFEFGPRDICAGNYRYGEDEELGVAKFVECPELADHRDSVLSVIRDALVGRLVSGVEATIDLAPCVENAPQPLNLLLRLDSGKEILISGEWMVRLSTPLPACKVHSVDGA